MEKKNVEERDSRFRQEVSKLRTQLSERKQRYAVKQQNPFYKKALPFLLMLLFVSCLLYIFADKEKHAELPLANEHPQIAKAGHNVLTEPDSKLPDSSDLVPDVADETEVVDAPAAADNRIDSTALEVSRPEKVVDVSSTPDTAPGITPETEKLYIAKSVACQEVRNRRFVAEQYTFSLAEDNTPVIWVDARTTHPPRTVTHIYYFEGQRYSVVPLAVKYPRMRTWSYVNLRSPDHVGSWRVDITKEDGEILEQIEFRVIP